MTDLQTPLRVTSAPEYTSNRNVLQANGVFLFRAPTEEIAAEIVRRCNEYEALQSQLLAQEAAVADAWNAEREELKLRAESAEAKLAEVPQLVVALKELRKDLPYVIASAEAGGIPDDYAFGFTIRITAGELRSIDAAIAAGEWR